MKILYFHGLDGFLSDEKRQVLEKYGEVIGPTLDYRSSENIIETLIDTYKNMGASCIIGNSMGGFIAYYVSLAYNVPCLVYNPALPYRSVKQNMPNGLPDREKYIQVVLGAQDELIKAHDVLAFLQVQFHKRNNASVHIINNIGHRIPIEHFDNELNFFFHQIS